MTLRNVSDTGSEDGPRFAPTWVHPVGDVPERGLEITREASDDERARLAAALDIRGCTALKAEYRVTPRSGGRYRLTGRIMATVEQRCVITLAPVTTGLDSRLDVEFRRTEDDGAEEGLLDPAADFNRDYEPIRRGIMDIGRVIYEQVAAVLDPYPRAPGATFQWTDPRQGGATGTSATASTGAASEPTHPFAVLRRLKNED